MSDEPEQIIVFPADNVRRNYTLVEIADKVAELALEKVLEKLDAVKDDTSNSR